MRARDFEFSESMVYKEILIFYGWVLLPIWAQANLYRPLRRLITTQKGL